MNNNDNKKDSSDEKRLPTTSEQLSISQKSLDEKIDDLLGPLFEIEGVNNAITIARDPKTDKISITYYGHFYDVTKLLGNVYKQFKQTIDSDLH